MRRDSGRDGLRRAPLLGALVRLAAAFPILVLSNAAAADEARARFNYMLHCQGCHLPDAVGAPGLVPRMKDFVGYFLHSDEGREFLVRVPGVSGAPVSDAELTELMNWLLVTYSRDQLPAEFAPYTVSEVAALRSRPETDPEKRRRDILRRIAAVSPELGVNAPDVPHGSHVADSPGSPDGL